MFNPNTVRTQIRRHVELIWGYDRVQIYLLGYLSVEPYARDSAARAAVVPKYKEQAKPKRKYT